MRDHVLREFSLQQIAKLWQIDPKHKTSNERGFAWLPASHTVLVTADLDQQAQRVRLAVETQFLTDIPIKQKNFTQLLDKLSPSWSSGFSFSYPPADVWTMLSRASKEAGVTPKLTLFSSAYVNENVALWLPEFLARMAITQPVFAEGFRNDPPDLFKGAKPDIQGEICKAPDEILDVIAELYIPAGQDESRWVGSDEFNAFAETHAQQDQCFGFGDEHGMSFETPFGSDTALVRFWTNQPHPMLGHGLLVTIQVRIGGDEEHVVSEAAFLNFLESRSWTDFPQLGTWHSKKNAGNGWVLAHSTFVPNLLRVHGLVSNLAFWALARVRWLRSTRFPNLTDRKMSEILSNRF